MNQKSILLPVLLVLLSVRVMFAQPNILLIFADDIGYEALGCYGGQDFATPELDRMAAQGLRFSRAYTSPVCTPSRVSLHTGLHTVDHGHTSVLPVHVGSAAKVDFSKMTTFAQLMRAAGYTTSTTGKWQLAGLEANPEHVSESGFDSWCIWQIWREGAKTGRHWDAALNEDGNLRDDIADRFGPDVINEYVIEQMTEARDAGLPFLIVHNELLPHEPIVRTPDDIAAGRDGTLGNMITYMDKLVGELLVAVEALGIRDNTYVFFMGDNGTEANHFPTRHTTRGNVTGGKRDLNDAGTHVALIAWGPENLPQGKTCDDLVDVTDLYPTFCALSDVNIPDRIPYAGRSLVPQLKGRPGLPRHWTHQEYNSTESVFDGSWRLDRNGKLIDARQLPLEQLVASDDADAAAARARLQPVFESLHAVNEPLVPGRIVDNADIQHVTFVGEWKTNSVTAGFYGADYTHDLNTDKGAKSVRFTLPIATNGTYEVFLRWTERANRASNVPITITDVADAHTQTVDQRSNGSQWNSMGTFSFVPGQPAELRIDTAGTDGYVIADAVRFVAAGDTNAPATPRGAWRLRTFGSEAIADVSREAWLWGDEADPDGDRDVNRIEYARGTHALVYDAHTPTHYFDSETGPVTLRAILRSNDTNLLVHPYVSENLLCGLWTDHALAITTREALSAEFEERTYSLLPDDVPTAGALYLTIGAVER